MEAAVKAEELPVVDEPTVSARLPLPADLQPDVKPADGPSSSSAATAAALPPDAQNECGGRGDALEAVPRASKEAEPSAATAVEEEAEISAMVGGEAGPSAMVVEEEAEPS